MVICTLRMLLAYKAKFPSQFILCQSKCKKIVLLHVCKSVGFCCFLRREDLSYAILIGKLIEHFTHIYSTTYARIRIECQLTHRVNRYDGLFDVSLGMQKNIIEQP